MQPKKSKLDHSLRSNFNVMVVFLLCLLFFSACVTVPKSHKRVRTGYNRDNIWNQNNWQIADFYLEYKKSSYVKDSLQRARPYLPYIHKTFQQYNLPLELAYLPMLESRFDVNAVSRTGAKGLWQFKKGTAIEYGLAVTWSGDERLDWRKATHAAAKYLKKLGKRFNYNWELALAGYNGGPNYIDKNVKQQHTWNFWDLQIRKEPMQYVARFLAMLKVAKKKYPHLYYIGINNLR